MEELPELQESEKGVLDSFLFLNASRPASAFGVISHIPLSEIKDYCSLFGIVGVQDFTNTIRRIDIHYVNTLYQIKDKDKDKE